MFTGIIEETGRLKSFDGGRLEIACAKILEDIKIGDSISTSGICLTVTEFGAECGCNAGDSSSNFIGNRRRGEFGAGNESW